MFKQSTAQMTYRTLIHAHIWASLCEFNMNNPTHKSAKFLYYVAYAKKKKLQDNKKITSHRNKNLIFMYVIEHWQVFCDVFNVNSSLLNVQNKLGKIDTSLEVGSK